jgi:hypothetical protein
MKTVNRTKHFKATPEEVFQCLDDLGVTGMHMTKSSMAMMGGEMDLQFLSEHRTGLHTRYRWTGTVLWMVLDFTVVVTHWVKGREKTWETIGPARLILYSWFRMQLFVEETSEGSRADLSITYERPEGLFNKVLCFFLGNWYAQWCLKNMLTDAEQKLDAGGVVSMVHS